MNILAIDTATEACSAALQVNDKDYLKYQVAPQQHSQLLLAMVEQLLAEADLSVGELDGLVFGRGPGSFTGVRIATGMAQGLAMSGNLPTVGVSSLATMAQSARHYAHGADLDGIALAGEASAGEEAAGEEAAGATHCIAAIDARMQEVYFGIFCSNDEGIMIAQQPEEVLAPDQAVAKIAAYLASLPASQTVCCVGTGWQAYEPLQTICDQHAQLRTTQILYPSADFMLEQAKPDLQAGNTLAPQDIQPLYVRDKVTWKKLPGR